MKKFTVMFEMESTITRTLEIEIIASSETSADHYAQNMIEDCDPRLYQDGKWEDADESKGIIIVADVSETEE